MRPYRLLCLLASATLLGSLTACESARQAGLLEQARARYYDMQSAGAKSFSCNVEPEWDTFFASGRRSPDSPFHVYLRQARLRFTQPLQGESQVTWIGPAGPPPPGTEAAAKQMEQSFHAMVDGFLQAWKPTLNGTMLPAQLVNNFTPYGDGYQLVVKDEEGRETLVTLDHSLNIHHLSVNGVKLHVEADTVFAPSPKGLVLTRIDTVSQPKGSTEPADRSSLEVTFADVAGFELPASMTVRTGSIVIPMHFTGCQVSRS